MINTDDCLLWARYHNPKGYGSIIVKINGKWTTKPAHRALYEAEYGELPKELVLDHLCRIPCCINLEHLEPVTNAENIKRGVFKRTSITHCPKGHEYTPENTYISKKNCRNCKECNRLSCRRYYHEYPGKWREYHRVK